jgi:hypothetical protein
MLSLLLQARVALPEMRVAIIPGESRDLKHDYLHQQPKRAIVNFFPRSSWALRCGKEQSVGP